MAAKGRKPNWGNKELAVLVDQCVEEYSVISGKLANSLTARNKDDFWLSVVEKVKVVGGVLREADEAQKKWRDLKSITKKKEQQRRAGMRKTGGGGQVCPLKDWEEKIISILPQAVVEGVAGGVDTSAEVLESCHVESETAKENDDSRIEDDEVLEEDVETQLGANSILHPASFCKSERGVAKRKRTAADLINAQYEFFEEATKNSQIKRQLMLQKLKTSKAQEEFFLQRLKKSREEDIEKLMYQTEF